MAESKKVMEQLTCKLCGYEWFPRFYGVTPDRCPRCKSKFWQVGRQRTSHKTSEGS